jgi:hypothetical protein
MTGARHEAPHQEHRVRRRRHVAGVNPVDRIDITYTEALLATVARAK